MPARLRWSSRASPSGRSGSAVSRRTASCSSQSGPSRSGPRWPTTWSSCSRSTSSTTPSWKPTPTLSPVSRTTRARWPALFQRSPAVVDPPGALHLEVGVQGPGCCHRSSASMRVSRCLPRETVSTTVPPDEVGGGDGRDPEVGAHEGAARQALVRAAGRSARPRRPRARQAARGAQPQPARRGDEPGGVEGRAQRGGAGAEELLAVGLLDGDPAQRAAAGGVGERVGGRLEPPSP